MIISSSEISAEVVGVARTVKYYHIVEQPAPFMYMPMSQTDETLMYLVIVTQADAASFGAVARNAVREVDPAQPIYDVHTLTDVVRQQSLFEEKIKAQIATEAAVIAVLLAAFGLYGILSYSVSQRRREIGIRIAVGATNGRMFGLIVFGRVIRTCACARNRNNRRTHYSSKRPQCLANLLSFYTVKSLKSGSVT